MSTVVGSCSAYPLKATKKEKRDMSLHFTIDGANGTITVANTVTSDPGFTVVLGAAGRYDLVFPVCPTDAIVIVQTHFVGGTFPTAGQFVRVSAKNTLAGTMSITLSTTYGGAAVAPSGGVGNIEFDVLIQAAIS